MPKMKSHSSAKKRFTLTGTGKVKRSHAGARHLMRKKTKKSKRHLAAGVIVCVEEEARIKRMLVK